LRISNRDLLVSRNISAKSLVLLNIENMCFLILSYLDPLSIKLVFCLILSMYNSCLSLQQAFVSFFPLLVLNLFKSIIS
jgi:hypothetical protein